MTLSSTRWRLFCFFPHTYIVDLPIPEPIGERLERSTFGDTENPEETTQATRPDKGGL
jgi:hypothetical protein